jgi:serine/threonine protein kinase
VKQALASQGDSAVSQQSEATAAYLSRPVPPEAEEIAKQFPQLHIIELLGQGGMGVVYKAKQPNLDRLVALKILPTEAAREPGFPERFTREARALAKLTHPGIVGVYDFGQQGGMYYLLMEFVDGMNLRQLLRQGKLNPAEALKIVPQICEALQYAHDEGIVHRDIKPENILLDKRGLVKIADFGLAKLLGQVPADSALTGSRQVMGTPHYMAPEQLEKPLAVDHRADIYSLGVVFYEMLTGELPLGRFPPPSRKVQVDVRLDEVVLRALEKEPEQRYQHISEVKTEVETIARKTAQAQAKTPSGELPAGAAGMDADELERLVLPLLPEKVVEAVKFYYARGATYSEAVCAIQTIARKHGIRLRRMPFDYSLVLGSWVGLMAGGGLFAAIGSPSMWGLSPLITIPLSVLVLAASLYGRLSPKKGSSFKSLL